LAAGVLPELLLEEEKFEDKYEALSGGSAGNWFQFPVAPFVERQRTPLGVRSKNWEPSHWICGRIDW
jgi:hypothetical protein